MVDTAEEVTVQMRCLNCARVAYENADESIAVLFELRNVGIILTIYQKPATFLFVTSV